MKRSEVLKTLANNIQNSSAYTAPIDSYLDGEAMAIEVLEYLEKLGMLPPKAQIPILVNGSETYITDYVWEKE